MRKDLLERARLKAVRLVRRLRPRFGLRPSDVLLPSFPKSGNTWVRFIWANLVALRELDGDTVDFHRLVRELGAEYDVHRYGSVDFESLPRLVKTHLPYEERRFGPYRTLHLYRHPGDVMVSYWHYLRKRRGGAPGPEDWGAFVRDEQVGVPAWCRHAASWRAAADVTVAYEELRADTRATMARALGELGVEPLERPTLEEAVERSRFERVRRLEEERGFPDDDEADEDYRFTRSGRSGEWRAVFAAPEAEYLRRRVEEHGLGDLVERSEELAP